MNLKPFFRSCFLGSCAIAKQKQLVFCYSFLRPSYAESKEED